MAITPAYYVPFTIAQPPSGNLTDFPVLFASQIDRTHVTDANGNDIGFGPNGDGSSPFFWEMERYNSATGDVVAHFKATTLHAVADTFACFYGDNTVSTFQSVASSVWNSAYLGVYHYRDGTTLSLADSTSNGNNGAPTNSPIAGAGKVDGGMALASVSTQYASTSNAINPAAITVECWVNATSFPHGYNTVWSRINGSVTVYSQFFITSAGKTAAYLQNVGATQLDPGSITLSTSTFYKVDWTYSTGTGLASYVNNASAGTAGGGFVLDTSAVTSYAGHDSATSSREWNGILDELRISNTVRSADWLTASYRNQNAPATFYTLGSETSNGSIVSATGAAAGVGAANGVGAVLGSIGSASGVGTALGVGAVTGSVGAASGIGTASALSATASAGSAAGVGGAAGVGTSTSTGLGVGAATGTGAAAAAGASIGTSSGSAAGVGTAAAVGATASIGSAAGVGSAAAVGATTGSRGTAAGIGTALAVGDTTGKRGSATGTGTALGVSAATAAAVGSATGVGTAVAPTGGGTTSSMGGLGEGFWFYFRNTSRLMDWVGYDPARSYLQILFLDKTRITYSGVNQIVVQTLINKAHGGQGQSPDEYYLSAIANSYPTVMVR
jgi:hypothetical protein